MWACPRPRKEASRGRSGAGAWTFSQNLRQKLDRWEGHMLRRILRIRKRPDDDCVAHFRRSQRIAKQVYARMGFQPLHVCVLARIFQMYRRAIPKEVAPFLPQPILGFSMWYVGKELFTGNQFKLLVVWTIRGTPTGVVEPGGSMLPTTPDPARQ